MDLRTFPPELLALVGAVLLGLAVVQTLRLLLWKRGKRVAIAWAREHGAQGEQRAEPMLVRRGFRVLGRQVARRYGIEVDGSLVQVDLRADYLVSRDAKRYVAEVKTGRFAPRIETPQTRRQLLEYRLAFDVDGVLLVNAESGNIRQVDFPLPTGGRRAGEFWLRARWLVVGVVVGVILTSRLGGLR